MSTHKLICKDSELAKHILSRWPAVDLKQKFDLFYQDQVPNTAAFLVKGFARSQSETAMIKLKAPLLLGFEELFYKKPATATLSIDSGAQVAIFDRVELINFINSDQKILKLIAG